ncbi:MAG TPA: prolyl oligopeptidase family serine peptidase [Bryobacteraceae bacterium]|nr:prolyl oligopeptidase family serine peptidase [Bryobacteraceae bacterium]
MRKIVSYTALALGATVLFAAKLMPPPTTKTEPVTDDIHGVKITDPYRWLENQNSPETRQWLEGQEKYARTYLDALPGRAELKKEFDALLKIDNLSAPVARNGRYFFSRRLAGEDRASLCMRQGFSGKDEVLVDPKAVTADSASSIFYQGISRDGNLIAYGIRKGGEDETEVHFLDVSTRKPLSDVIPRGRFSGFSITPDKGGIYYSVIPAKGSRVYHHAMGTPASSDKEIFGSGYGPTQLISSGLSEDGRWLLLIVADGVPAKKNEIYLKDVEHNGPVQTVVNDIEAEFDPDFAGDSLILTTNWNAPNRKIFRTDLKTPTREHWKEIVPEGKLAIDVVSPAGGRIFISFLDNVVTRVKQFDLNGKDLGDIKLPGIGSGSPPSGRWTDDELFFSFTSFVVPPSTYRYFPSSGKEDLWFQPKVPIHTGDMEVKQVWYPSKDGTKIPMFIVSRKGLALDGKNPVLMTAYGGFNVSLTPAFSSIAAWWTEHGGVFVQPNLRGGGEFGETWHRAGMFEMKQNVFDDFIAAAEWLVQNKYTNPSKLAIQGGSNGGLLMGAMMTQRPDLFGAIICGAPLLDMLRFQKMSVGSWWTAEYGSADDPKQFQYLLKYSPYQNVHKGTKYPPIMFVTGDSDTRVDPAHARKMAALMQADNGSSNPILLRYDTKGGHSGIGSVDKVIDQQVDQMSFIADRLGVKIQ